MLRALLVAGLVLVATPGFAQVNIGFETCLPGAGTLPCPSGWVSTGGNVNILPDPAGAITGPMFGFPTEGGQWAVVSSAGATGALTPPPAGGPAPYPLASGSTGNVIFPNVTLPAGPGATLNFDYTWCTPECPSDPTYNDFFTVDFVDPTTGASLQNVLYHDTFDAGLVLPITTDAQGNLPAGFCPGMEGEVGPAGAPKSVSFPIPPALQGMNVNIEFHVGDATDAGFNGYVWLDRVELTGGASGPTITLSSPSGAGSIQVDNNGLTAGTEVFNVFTINEPCPSGVGTGPFAGLCTNNLAFLVTQVTLPLGSLPFHFIAPGSTFSFGPLPAGTLPSGTILEAVCLNGLNFSPVTQHIIP